MKNSTIRSPFSDQEINEIRKKFPVTKTDKVYLNHAAISPLSTPVVESIQNRMKWRSQKEIDDFKRDLVVMDALRKKAAKLIHAESEHRITFPSNTSQGLNIVASGLQWHNGDRILIPDYEFPANVYPFLSLESEGVEIDRLHNKDGRITPEMVEAALTSKTRMVAVSAVQFLNGFKADLKAIGEICQQHHAWFVVDGIQALGAIQLDVQDLMIDALAAGGHKWLMGPQGFGMLYLNKEIQDNIVNQHIGWLSVEEPWDLFNTEQALNDTASRFELGTPNANGAYGLNASLELLLETGPERIEEHIAFLTQTLIDEFEEIDQVTLATPPEKKQRAGIVTIKLADEIDAEELLQMMLAKKVTIAQRSGLLRFAPHFYNTHDEMMEAAAIMKECITDIN